jgi:predicted RNA-binding protein with PUA-like domain
MNYWLIKSEPGTYSIDDLHRDRRTKWDGVRNFRARNYMKEMKEGDLVLFYHSSAEPPGVAGIAKVDREAYPDPSQFDPKSEYHDPKSTRDNPRWWLVDVAFVDKLDRLVTLPEIKAEPALADMVLVNNSRLSVQPVTKAEFDKVKKMARSAG